MTALKTCGLVVASLLALSAPATADSISDQLADQQAQLAKMKAEFTRLEEKIHADRIDMENEAFQRSYHNNDWTPPFRPFTAEEWSSFMKPPPTEVRPECSKGGFLPAECVKPAGLIKGTRNGYECQRGWFTTSCVYVIRDDND